MEIKEFYNQIGGSYEDALSRLMNDALIEKFLFKFKDTQSLSALEEAIHKKDYDKAFFEIHTLKGVALNLALKKLGEASCVLTELIRGDLAKTADSNQVNAAYEKVEECYLEVISYIK